MDIQNKPRRQIASQKHEQLAEGQYDIYPAFPIGTQKISSGYQQLAAQLADQRRVILDGYGGVNWVEVRQQLDQALKQLGINTQWINIDGVLRTEDQIEALTQPFMGGDDPIFGTLFTGTLTDFFDPAKLSALSQAYTTNPSGISLVIIYGCGAALSGLDGYLVYIDVPKHEIQLRSRAGTICNLGLSTPLSPKVMYKRFYFVDWIALNQHKATLLPTIDLMVDGQDTGSPVFCSETTLRQALHDISRNYFRARPWFEPGVWGGQWIKQHIPQLPQDVPNYAWSFELIVPENGLMLESDGNLLEISFDCLMIQEEVAVLGEAAARFGREFPIRFDFLDTVDGGNLSIQCHPRPDYMKQHFGHNFTQDETYYILDCNANAKVYLGFVKDVDPDLFSTQLENSFKQSVPIEIEQFVNVESADKHDLFLIPNGTIHAAGEGSLILEISATPYIFTFKMYDWVRLGLDHQPRPLNIDRALENLYFERQGEYVQQKLISKPVLLEQGEGWTLTHLPTHAEHFYDVHRLTLDPASSISIHTHNQCHILSLVEGSSIRVETENGRQTSFNYAETFVIPAAANSYRLMNPTDRPLMVIKAFVKSHPDSLNKK
ncbi:MAG: class I mannose-6-phosphate isomerase [Anaerolineae bacterium]|nr:class I mannose-6-phosphate isomerase [Anaerolineae bacterium]